MTFVENLQSEMAGSHTLSSCQRQLLFSSVSGTPAQWGWDPGSAIPEHPTCPVGASFGSLSNCNYCVASGWILCLSLMDSYFFVSASGCSASLFWQHDDGSQLPKGKATAESSFRTFTCRRSNEEAATPTMFGPIKRSRDILKSCNRSTIPLTWMWIFSN